MTEDWRTIVGTGYQVSDHGNVRRAVAGRATWPGRPLRPFLNPNGYLTVSLVTGGKNHTHTIHTLVAGAFIGPRPIGHDVNHRDGNKTNNAAENLEYVTRSGNVTHAHALGLIRPRPPKVKPPPQARLSGDRHWTAVHPERVRRGEACHAAKLTAQQVAEIQALVADGKRQCEVAAQFGMSRAQVNRIVHGTRWRGGAG